MPHGHEGAARPVAKRVHRFRRARPLGLGRRGEPQGRGRVCVLRYLGRLGYWGERMYLEVVGHVEEGGDLMQETRGLGWLSTKPERAKLFS